MNRLSRLIRSPALAATLWIAACTGTGPGARPSAAPTLQELRQSAFQGVYEAPVVLTDGVYTGAPYVEHGTSRPSVQLVEGIYLTGDIGKDGRSEAAVFLAEQAAGSGTRLYLALTAREASGAVRNLATSLIGDRVQIIEASMSGDGITLRLVRAGPGDAACCPGEIASVRWTLIDGMLDLISERIEGRLTTAELGGSRWRLESLAIGDAAVADPAITLAVDAGRVSGRSGCNAYSGAIEDGDRPGQIRVGPLAGTRMACEADLMRLEDAYLNAIQAADHFSFLTGTLVLTSVDGSGRITRLSFMREGDHPSAP